MIAVLWIIGILIVTIVAGCLYCDFRTKEVPEPDYKAKYLKELKINKELLEEVIKKTDEL